MGSDRVLDSQWASHPATVRLGGKNNGIGLVDRRLCVFRCCERKGFDACLALGLAI